VFANNLNEKVRSSVAITLTLLWFPTLTLSGDNSTCCEAILDQAKQLSRTGSLRAAENLLRSAISKSPDPGTLDAIELWNELGHVHQLQSELSLAERDYQGAIRLNEGLKTPRFVDLAISLNNLGSIAEARRQFVVAEGLFRRALSALNTGGALSNPVTGSVLTNLAMSIQKQSRFSEAAPLYERGIPRLRDSYGEKSVEYAKALSNFALFKFETGKYLQALNLQRKTCQIQSSLQLVSNDDKALALNNLALTLSQLGSFSEAEGYVREAIELERSTSSQDPNLVETLNNLAVLEEKAGDFPQARNDQTEALKLALREFPAGDPIIAASWNNLGKIAVAQRRFREAEEFYRKAEVGWRDGGRASAGYAATLSNMAGLEAKRGHHKQARELYQQALKMDESILGSNHPRVASDLSNLAIQMALQKRYNEAVPLFGRAIKIDEVAFGTENLEVARTVRNLAAVYWAAKQLPEADQAYRRAIHISRISGENNPDLMSWLYEYAGLLRKEEKFSEAEQADVDASRIRVHNAITAVKQNERSSNGSAFR
jgi:tetratricopeptide (TPR) repeat protein